MRNSLVLLLCAASLEATTQYSVRTTGQSGQWTDSLGIHAGNPYQAGTRPMRFEVRIHNFGSSILSGYDMLRLGEFGVTATGGGWLAYQSGGFGWSPGDIQPAGQQAVSCCAKGVPGANGDIVLRIQRDTAGVSCGGSACVTFEVCWTLGGYCGVSTTPLTLVSSWASGVDVAVLSAGFDVAFIRWFPSVVEAGVVGTSLLNPIQLAAPATPSALTGDWEFENSTNDASGNTGALTDGPSSSHWFEATPVYPPLCVPGSWQSGRAGSAITLSTAGSIPLDGGSTLAALWQQVPGVSPAPVQWVGSQAIANPTVILPQFGSYNFQLTVTDGSGQSATCVAHDGAAPSDNNGVVVYPPGAFYSAANQFLGPLIQWGKNPWPWYDTDHQIAADLNRAALGPPAGNGQMVTALAAALGASDTSLTVGSTYTFSAGSAVLIGSEQILLGPNTDGTHVTIWQRGYRGTTAAAAPSGTAVNQFYYWDWYNYNAGPGTVTVTTGSGILTGSNTHFMTGGQYALCDSSGNALPSTYLVIWHPTDTAKTGRELTSVSGCASDTQATLSASWGNVSVNTGMPGGPGVPAGSGLTYSIATGGQTWWFDMLGDPRTINYYDNVVGYYLLWLRSGIDVYLIAARQLADLFYFGPGFNQRYDASNAAGTGSGYQGRARSALGLWLRSKDSPQVDMTTGLERAATYALYVLSFYNVYLQQVVDTRESGYLLAELGYTAALDTSTTTYNLSNLVPGQTNRTYSQIAATAIAELVNPTGTPSWFNNLSNYWYTTQDSSGDWPGNGNGPSNYTSAGGTATVSLVNGSPNVTGTNSAFNCSDPWGTLSPGAPVWFWHGTPSVFPPNNAAGDPVGYTIASCIDATHLTLTANYAGASCASCGYEIVNNASGKQYNGWGGTGFMMGIATRGMHYAAGAISTSDPTNSAYARTLAMNAGSWLLNHAYRQDTHSFNVGVDYVNCQVPIPWSNTNCTQSTTISESLGWSAEGLVGLMSTYAYSGDSATKAAADAMYNQMWANPNVPCSNPCDNTATAGGNYMTQLDASLGTGTAFMLDGTPPSPKWFGQYFGFGDYSAWPAVRLGGVASTTTRQVYIAFSLAGVPNAAKVVAVVTAPDGTTTSTNCVTSPCVVTVPRADQPGNSIQTQYQSAGGAVLASSSQAVMETQ